jgi:hypothetical protein
VQPTSVFVSGAKNGGMPEECWKTYLEIIN